MELYYATTNKGKLATLQRELDPYSIKVIQVPLNIPEPRSSDVQEIATKKVEIAYHSLHKPVAALDAGFYIRALNGFPRAFANFALETIGIEGILKLMEGKEGQERSCEFRECMAYIDSTGDIAAFTKAFVGRVPGTVAKEKRGTKQPHHWSELALIFIPEGYDRTLAELTSEEYDHWRKNRPESYSASKMFAQWIGKRIGN